MADHYGMTPRDFYDRPRLADDARETVEKSCDDQRVIRDTLVWLLTLVDTWHEKWIMSRRAPLADRLTDKSEPWLLRFDGNLVTVSDGQRAHRAPAPSAYGPTLKYLADVTASNPARNPELTFGHLKQPLKLIFHPERQVDHRTIVQYLHTEKENQNGN